jgi:hypothetical protein
MFQFTRFPPHTLCVQVWVAWHYPRGVSPFGNLRIYAFVQLPGAFRRLRVLRRRFVPRHSSRTLKSLLLATFESSMHDSTISICNCQRARAPHRTFRRAANGDDTRAPNSCQALSKFSEIFPGVIRSEHRIEILCSHLSLQRRQPNGRSRFVESPRPRLPAGIAGAHGPPHAVQEASPASRGGGGRLRCVSFDRVRRRALYSTPPGLKPFRAFRES